jgi:hypothetical protein
VRFCAGGAGRPASLPRHRRAPILFTHDVEIADERPEAWVIFRVDETGIEPVPPPVRCNPVYTILSIGVRLWAEFNDSGVDSIWP